MKYLITLLTCLFFVCCSSVAPQVVSDPIEQEPLECEYVVERVIEHINTRAQIVVENDPFVFEIKTIGTDYVCERDNAATINLTQFMKYTSQDSPIVFCVHYKLTLLAIIGSETNDLYLEQKDMVILSLDVCK